MEQAIRGMMEAVEPPAVAVVTKTQTMTRRESSPTVMTRMTHRRKILPS
jgi:hypothetical protein